MDPIPSSLMSSGSKKKEPRYAHLSETKDSHSHRTWTEVSSSVPHFLQVGLLLNPTTYRFLLRVLCPVSRPITTLDCVLLKDSNRAPLARACLCVLQGPIRVYIYIKREKERESTCIIEHYIHT
jgi:hypothetical protein